MCVRLGGGTTARRGKGREGRHGVRFWLYSVQMLLFVFELIVKKRTLVRLGDVQPF